jgi:hypothetical protein
VAYRIRCPRCDYRDTYVTRESAVAAALRHRAMTEHDGIDIEDAAADAN